MVLLVLLLPIAVWQGWAFMHAIPITPEVAAPRVTHTQPVYVAIMGVDEREHDVGRSDTLLLLRLDGKAQSVQVINIPRDTRIVASDGDRAKINSAYAAGGAAATTKVLANLLGIPQPYYVTVNFQAFEELVDQVGGVELTIKKHYVYDDPYQDLHIDLPEGRHTLLGAEALHYVRLRYDGDTNTDIARIGRQQEFMKAFLAKLPANWTRIPGMITALRKYVRTNIPEDDQLTLAKALWTARDQVTMETLPGKLPEDPNDQSGDWLLDPLKWNEVKRTWANP